MEGLIDTTDCCRFFVFIFRMGVLSWHCNFYDNLSTESFDDKIGYGVVPGCPFKIVATDPHIKYHLPA